MNLTPTAVSGVLAAHATDREGRTGVTTFLFPQGAHTGVFQPGSATGSREIAALDPTHLAPLAHGICLAGGSAYGLAAADGVLRSLARRGVGFPTPHGVVPIVPAAILFDLHTATRRPDAAMGEQAADAASTDPLPEGAVGAATGARVGSASGESAQGGFGCWAEATSEGIVAVGVAVNAAGSVVDPATGALVAGGKPVRGPVRAALGGQTTLAVVLTDQPLDRAACVVVARMASAGLARTLYPAFTPFDGDLVFAASTGRGASVSAERIAEIGDAAAHALAIAVLRAVRR